MAICLYDATETPESVHITCDQPTLASLTGAAGLMQTSAMIKQLKTTTTTKPRSKKLTSDKFARLIDLYKENRCLWDVTLVHTSREQRRKAIKAIGTQLGVSASEVAIKWQNLRTTFGRHLKKITISSRSDSGMDDVYVPRWKYFKRMEFLTECVRGRTYKPNKAYPQVIISDVYPIKTEEETGGLALETTESFTKECMTPGSSISIDDMLSISPMPASPQSGQPCEAAATPKRKRTDESSARGSHLLDLAVSRLEASASCQSLSMYRHFGEWVGSYIEQLPEKRRIDVMQEINEILFRASKS